MHWSLSKSSLPLPYSDNIALYCLSENAEGKYISPFHDIPMYADESQVGLTSLHRGHHYSNCVQYFHPKIIVSIDL